MPLSARVSVPGPITTRQLDELRAALAEADLFTEELVVIQRRTVAQTVVVVVITASLTHFFAAVATEAGKDTYVRLKRLVARALANGGHSHDGAVVLEDEVSGPAVELTSELPDDAYAALLLLDIAALPEGQLSWDHDAGRWRHADRAR
jgi:hypothetical protein